MELKLEKSYLVNTKNDGVHFVIIGCGGNGGYLIRDLARQVAIANSRLAASGSRAKHRITLIDADVIEEKNIGRQNFVMADVGKFKSEVLANRYSQAYGDEIEYKVEYISTADQLVSVGRVHGSLPFIVGCVDNNKTRAIIHNAMKTFHSYQIRAFWLDGGNEEYSGQIVLGSVGHGQSFRVSFEQLDQHGYERYNSHYNTNGAICNLPLVTQVYPEMLLAQDKHPSEISCDDRSVSSPQCIVTNIMVATLMMSFCNYFLGMDEGLKTWSTSFSIKNINMTSRFVNKTELTQYAAGL